MFMPPTLKKWGTYWFRLGAAIAVYVTVHVYAPNFEKVWDILVSACPYVCVCVCVCVCVFMFEISS